MKQERKYLSIIISICSLVAFVYITEYQECWLGEQGKKVGAAYVGLDDYTSVKPNFETSYSFKTSDGLVAGTFDDFINEDV